MRVMEKTDLLSLTEVAEMLKITRPSVFEAITSGRLPATKIGSQWVVSRGDLESYQPRAYKGKRANTRPEGVKGPGGRPKKIQATPKAEGP
jgi:excisionase family DNA binding protein